MFLRLFVSLSLTALVFYLSACGATPVPTVNPGAALRDATWTLVYMGAPADQATALTKYNNITALFGADGRLTGKGGCNTYMGGYTLDDSRLTVTPLASTKMACPDGNIMQQEQMYLGALQKGGTVTVSGNGLRILFDNGAGVLVFTRG